MAVSRLSVKENSTKICLQFELALALLQASSCFAICIRLAECYASDINMTQRCAFSMNNIAQIQ